MKKQFNLKYRFVPLFCPTKKNGEIKFKSWYTSQVVINRAGGVRRVVNIKLDVFEGPFDLLLALLEKNKLDVTDIQISIIADQYIDVLNADFDMEIASEFLVMASWLLHLKSKKILPKEEKDEDEEITEEELVRRLTLYKKYRDATPEITEKYDYWSRSYYKMPEALQYPKLYQPADIDIDDIVSVYRDVNERYKLRHNDNRENMERILKVEKVSIKDKMKQVVSNVLRKAKTCFSEMFSAAKNSRAEIVTGFLALLELERRKRVRVRQTENFGEILVLPGEDIENDDYGFTDDSGLNGDFTDE